MRRRLYRQLITRVEAQENGKTTPGPASAAWAAIFIK